MAYITANKVLPPHLLEAIQAYVDGAYLYIPRRAGQKKAWGEISRGRQELDQRNREILRLYKAGQRVAKLAALYCLSEKTIYKVIASQESEN